MPIPEVLSRPIHVPSGYKVKFRAQVINDGYRHIFIQVTLNAGFVIDCHTGANLSQEFISTVAPNDQVFYIQSGYKNPPFGQNHFHGDYSDITASPYKCEVGIFLSPGIGVPKLGSISIELFQ